MRNAWPYKKTSVALVLGLGFLGAVWHPAVAQVSPSVQQAGNLAGYVLNQETNMGYLYTRQLNQRLINPSLERPAEPVIQYEGPMPQPPAMGPIWQRSTHARPLPTRQAPP